MFDFKDPAVIVTGAGGNLGTGLARAFHNAGARIGLSDTHVSIASRSSPTMIEGIHACQLPTYGRGGAPQAARIMAIAATSKGVRNRLLDMVSPSFNIGEPRTERFSFLSGAAPAFVSFA